jgi:hypothetical protein
VEVKGPTPCRKERGKEWGPGASCFYNSQRRVEEGCVGAWGTGSFENDDAADWFAGLGTITPDDLTKILVQAADEPGYLEAPAAYTAVAAGEVAAALNGSAAEGAPAAIADWVKKYPQALTPELRAVAIRALERVRRNSELKDLWLEADGLNEWIAAIRELQGRLGG